MESEELSNEQWKFINPHLPPKPVTRRKRADDHKVINCILFVLINGCRWGRYARMLWFKCNYIEKTKKMFLGGYLGSDHGIPSGFLLRLMVCSPIEMKNGKVIVIEFTRKQKGILEKMNLCT